MTKCLKSKRDPIGFGGHAPLSSEERFLIGIIVLVCSQSLTTSAWAGALRAEDHILVRFRAQEVEVSIRRDDPLILEKLLQSLPLPMGARVHEMPVARMLREHRALSRGGVSVDQPDLNRPMYLTLPRGLAPEKAVAILKGNHLVDYAEVDPLGRGGDLSPDDPSYNLQWHLGGVPSAGHISAPAAWEWTTGSSNIIVAVLDTGVFTNSAEFSGRIVSGYDFVNDDADPADDNNHGTFVASILAATGNNNYRVAGVNWACRIMPVKVLDAYNAGFYSDWAQGIDWAVEHGARVINLSAGGSLSNETLAASVTNAISRGVVFVTITHNKPDFSSIAFPGSMTEPITVGASDSNGMLCAFSIAGSTVDLVAPGTGIVAILKSGNISTGRGTSFAAPQVAGVASLILALRPELSHAEVRDILCAGARDQVSADPNDVPGFDNYYGWGILNASNSMLLGNVRLEPSLNASNGACTLSWTVAGNAADKDLFKIQYAAAVTGTWTAATGVVYNGSRAFWTDDGTQTGSHPATATQRFYRAILRSY